MHQKKKLLLHKQRPKFVLPETSDTHNMKLFFSGIANYMRSQVEKNGTSHYVFGLFAILNYMIPVFTVGIIDDPIRDLVIYLRIVAVVMCLLLLFIEYWPQDLKRKYYHLYWYICLLFCLPFIASYTVCATHISEFWLLNAILSIVLLFILVDWRSFIVLLSIGLICGYALYGLLIYKRSSALYEPSYDALLLTYLYTFLTMIIILFVKDKEKENEKRIETMQLFGGAIAHEVNTPIASMHMLASTMLALTKSLINTTKCHHKDGEQVYYSVNLSEEDYKMLMEVLPQDLMHTINEAKKIIEVLLLLLKHKVADNNRKYSMREVVREALRDYVIDPSQRKRITFKQNYDFMFCGPKQYIKQVLQNLLTNAFKYAGEHAYISIWLEGTKLHFKDNGHGIHLDYQKHIFKPFYTRSSTGTGIGLAFCNILVDHMKGYMECHSELGKYTEFVIWLPEAK